ncbi:SGNH/GDSL hydrolase family protein [Pirellulaceae bacterium]|jgi:hypothetical protein|nr:SGNH/GDSL hydrolase family protein [Pirellulaceae bacterium]
MTSTLRNILVVLLILVCGPMFAQQDERPLPNVLIIGDSVYQQHARGLLSDFKNQANVQFASWHKFVLPNSTNAIEDIDLLLGLKDAAGNVVSADKLPKWDLIHFNVGLGDLVYCVPNIKSHRILSFDCGGVIRTDAKEYEQNLETLIRLLKHKAPSAKIVWASTTPIRHSRANVFKKGTEIQYNQIAERVMKKHGVPINDMYSYVRSFMDMDKPAGHGADPFFFDKKPIHEPIQKYIMQELGLNVAP